MQSFMTSPSSGILSHGIRSYGRAPPPRCAGPSAEATPNEPMAVPQQFPEVDPGVGGRMPAEYGLAQNRLGLDWMPASAGHPPVDRILARVVGRVREGRCRQTAGSYASLICSDFILTLWWAAWRWPGVGT